MATTKVSLKLLIDTKAKRVLFAEGGKDFIDFLILNLLHLPVGTVVRLLTKQSTVGTLGNLYQSIENLGDTYLQPHQTKQSVLKPKAPVSCSSHDVPLLLLDDTSGVKAEKSFYSCLNNQYHYYVTDESGALCPDCNGPLSREMTYVGPPVAKEVLAAVREGGFVKGVVPYMVMDDLVVSPMDSPISCITLLHKFNVKEVGALEERVVDLGVDEGLKLLKASLETKTVLTSVFLGNTGASSSSERQ